MKSITYFFALFFCNLSPILAANPIVWNGTTDTEWYSDQRDSFVITTAEQLAGLAKLVNGGIDFKNKTINLGANIMLNDTTDWQGWENNPPENIWTSIGYGNAIVGTFDGNGYVVSGVYINSTGNGLGLFGTVDYFGGGIKNLGVTASYIKSEGIRVGGLLGNNKYGYIDNCYFVGMVTGTSEVGGLVGTNGFSIRNSYFTGTVMGKNHIGGLVGDNWDGTIWDSYSTGMVMGESSIGGLAGHNGKSISNSYSTSNVIGTKSNIGGLVGRNANLSTINSSYSTGSVEGKENVGGLVGSNGDADDAWATYWGKIINSYSTSIVTGEANVGGLVGANNNSGQIKHSYSIGSVTGESDIGGLVGKRIGYSLIDSSYYDMQTSGQSGNFGKTTAQMKRMATYIDWDFNDIWGRKNTINDGYPYLRRSISENLPNDEDEPVSPIRLPQIANTQIFIQTINNVIVLENLPANAKVEIYNLQGKRIAIPVNAKGIYIVKAATKTFRIAVK